MVEDGGNPAIEFGSDPRLLRFEVNELHVPMLPPLVGCRVHERQDLGRWTVCGNRAPWAWLCGVTDCSASQVSAVIDRDEIFGGHLYGLCLPEEIHEDLDPIFGGHVPLYYCANALEGTFGDFDFIAWFHHWIECFDFFGTYLGPKEIDEAGIDGGAVISKVNDGGDAIGVGHGAAAAFEVESGEDVAREHRLMEENFASLRGFVVADPRAERFDVSEDAEVGGSNVFALGLGAEGVPGGSIREMMAWAIGFRFWGHCGSNR